MDTKICSGCKRDLPNTPEYFYRCRTNADGLFTRCKVCQAASDRAWRRRRKERIIRLRIKAKREGYPRTRIGDLVGFPNLPQI